jgi:hypothetical protein
MGASTIVVNGRRVAVPNSYSEVDASALEVPSFGATGIIALMATGIGGTPYTEINTPDDWDEAGTSSKVMDLCREGDMRELGAIMFAPAKDPDIPSGAARVVMVKVNPAAASSITLDDADGDALTLTSKDFGLFTTQIHVTVAAGTNGGKQVLIEFEDEEELLDDLGMDPKFSLRYTGAAGAKATTAALTSTADGIDIEFTRTAAGLDTGFTQAPGDSALEVVSSNAGDTTQTFTLYGLNGAGVPTATPVTLNGVTPVALGTWDLVTGGTLSASAAGTVTVRIVAGATVKTWLTTVLTHGITTLDIPVDGDLSIVSSGASVRQVVLRGTNAAGAAVSAVRTLTGTTPLTVLLSATSIVHLTSVELGDVEAAQTLTISGLMLEADVATYPTLVKLRDKLATMTDFDFADLSGEEFFLTDLDYVDSVSILNADTEFSAVLFDMIEEITDRSQLVDAARATPGNGAPTNVGPLYLSGGHEGDAGNPGVPTATNDDWQACFDLLKQKFVNTIVVGATNAAIHAQADAHAAYMGGIGRMERDVVVPATVGETLAALKTRAVNLNSRHVALVGQEVLLFDTEGAQTWQPPMFQAALVAAMQAGAKEIGTPLTNKYVNCLGVRQHSSWNPTEDADEAILGGLLFMQRVEGKGVKVVRNITTYLSKDNPAYVERSMNECVNVATYRFRTAMELGIGKKAFAGTLNALQALAITVLDQLVRDNIISSYKKPVFTITGDTADVVLEIAPIGPLNFAKTKVHLRSATFSSVAA